jgi:hypothetical protein
VGEGTSALSARVPEAPGVALDPSLLERVRDVRAALSPPRDRDRSRAALAGTLALGSLVACSLGLALVAAGQPTILVPRSRADFPAWLAGPLHAISGDLAIRARPTAVLLSVTLVLMAIAYGVALRCAPLLRSRVVIGAILALHIVWLLTPLMPLTDVFNYLAYARLGVLRGINPYLHGIAALRHDPAFVFTTWHHLPSPYGPLFTLVSYALAPLPLWLAYWVLKLATVAASLGCVALLWRCARQLGRPPLRPVLLYATNPLVLVYGLGGFHNDVFMLLPILGAISLVLARREARAGATAVVAVAVKASAGVLLPFLVLGARRRGRMTLAAAVVATALAAVSVAVFGLTYPDLSDQSTLLTSFSIPNVIGQLAGLGGAPPWLLRAAAGAMAATVVLLALRTWRGRIDWIEASAWATLTLILSLSWLVPWYVMWLLPLVALTSSRALWKAALVLSVYLVLVFLPVTGMLMQSVGYQPLDTAIGRASVANVDRLMGRIGIAGPAGSARRRALTQSRGHEALRAARRKLR